MKKLILFLTMVIMAMAVSVQADVMRWDASTGDVDGYTIYYGNESGVYPFHEDVGNVLEVGTPNVDGALAEHFELNPGTWYFIVRAYNVSGESGDSNIADLAVAGRVITDDVFPIKIVVPATTTITITQE